VFSTSACCRPPGDPTNVGYVLEIRAAPGTAPGACPNDRPGRAILVRGPVPTSSPAYQQRVCWPGRLAVDPRSCSFDSRSPPLGGIVLRAPHRAGRRDMQTRGNAGCNETRSGSGMVFITTRRQLRRDLGCLGTGSGSSDGASSDRPQSEGTSLRKTRGVPRHRRRLLLREFVRDIPRSHGSEEARGTESRPARACRGRWNTENRRCQG